MCHPVASLIVQRCSPISFHRLVKTRIPAEDAGGGRAAEDDVVDADFEEVKDDDKKA